MRIRATRLRGPAMIDTPSGVTARAAGLRHDFDRAFAEPIRFDTRSTEDLLAVRIGPQAYAIRLSEITLVGKIRCCEIASSLPWIMT